MPNNLRYNGIDYSSFHDANIILTEDLLADFIHYNAANPHPRKPLKEGGEREERRRRGGGESNQWLPKG